jgi:hypothetical protein
MTISFQRPATERSLTVQKPLHFEARGFEMTVGFFPQIAMVRKNGLSLASNLAKYHELSDIHFSDERWEFKRPMASEGEPRGLIRVSVEESQITIRHRFPTTGLERFERLCEQVLDSFESPLTPEFLFSTIARLEYVTTIGKDSRISLLDGLNLGKEGEPGKVDAFGRPCSSVAVRLRFPPYEIIEDEAEATDAPTEQGPSDQALIPVSSESTSQDDTEEGSAEWQAIVTVSSLSDDPEKVSVEVDARWVKPAPWEAGASLISERLRIAEQFLRTSVAKFLEHFGGDDP